MGVTRPLIPLTSGPVRDRVLSCIKALSWAAWKVRCPPYVDRRDLAQDAYFALHRAAENYDATRGRFASLGVESIKYSTKYEALRYRCVGMINHRARGGFRRIQTNFAVITDNDAGDRLEAMRLEFRPINPCGDVAWWDVGAYLSWRDGERTLSEVVEESDPCDVTLADVIPSASPSPEDEKSASEYERIGAKMFGHEALTAREQDVLHWRFVDDMTLEEIGARLGVTKQRTKQLEAQALTKLRPFAEKMI